MSTHPLNVDNLRYDAMIGVGGIGAGSFFQVEGNATVGREESRAGRFLDRRDYCKLHIISHYVKTLLGAQFAVIPVGNVGDDYAGKRLLEEMREVGLDMSHVRVLRGVDTLFSFCFVYPDGSGGNFTTNDSACARLTAADVLQVEPDFSRYRGRGIALAVPEVSLEARMAVLDLGTEYEFFRVASFVSTEIGAAVDSGMLGKVDLLAINIDEARALLGLDAVGTSAEEVARRAISHISQTNRGMLVSITAGRHGSWCWDGAHTSYVPVLNVEMKSTAGAGDAHLSGIIAGLAAGLSFAQAHELGALTAALSVTSVHTINNQIDRRLLREFVDASGARVSDMVDDLIGD